MQNGLHPGEEVRETPPKLVRGPRTKNDDHDPVAAAKRKAEGKGPDTRNNPKTTTDSMEQVTDPETGKVTKKPYTKAENGDPIEGTRHHAEQRMERGASDNGEDLLTQQPTRKCCPGCSQTLSDAGTLSKVPRAGSCPRLLHRAAPPRCAWDHWGTPSAPPDPRAAAAAGGLVIETWRS